MRKPPGSVHKTRKGGISMQVKTQLTAGFDLEDYAADPGSGGSGGG